MKIFFQNWESLLFKGCTTTSACDTLSHDTFELTLLQQKFSQLSNTNVCLMDDDARNIKDENDVSQVRKILALSKLHMHDYLRLLRRPQRVTA